MIKTDKVIYRTRTQEEYDWLMKKLEEAGLRWVNGCFPTASKGDNNWREYFSETCIRTDDEGIAFADFDFYKNESDYKDYEFIEVSDLMETEEETDILDKLETMNEYLNNRLKKLKLEEDDDDEESQKIKKIVYTTEVYFE